MRKLILLLFCSWYTSLSGQEVTSMSLNEAVVFAQENDLGVKNSRMAIDDAEQQIVEQRAAGLPQVNGEIGYQYYFQIPVISFPNPVNGERTNISFALENNLSLGLNASALVFDGSYIVGLRAAKLYRDYTAQDHISKQVDLKNRVVEAYLPVLILNESLIIIDKNIENVTKLLNETRETYKAGFVEQLDVDRLDLSLANLQVEKENLERQREILLNNLKFTINFPLAKDLQVADDIEGLLIQATSEELSEKVNFFRRPEYRVADLGIQLNHMNIDRYRAGYLPTLKLIGTYQQGYQGKRLFHEDGFWAGTGIIGATVNIPIFDGLRKKANIQRAKIELMIAENQKSILENAITLEVRNARTNYLMAKKRTDNQSDNLQLAKRIYETTQVKYREGVGSSLEVTQAEEGLYRSQQNYIQSMYDLLLAKAALDKALGSVQ